MENKPVAFRVQDLEPSVRTLVEDKQLDANKDGVIGAEDAPALAALADGVETPQGSPETQQLARQLLSVARGQVDAAFVPRPEAPSKAIRDLITRDAAKAGIGIQGAREPLNASEIRTQKVKELFTQSHVDPKALEPKERALLLSALLDDWWVAPTDIPDGVFGGVIAENEEGMVASIIEATPAHHKAQLAELLLQTKLDRGDALADRLKRLFGLLPKEGTLALAERMNDVVNKQSYRDRINVALGPALEQARLRLAESQAAGDVATTSVLEATQRVRLDKGVQLASRYLNENVFLTGGPYTGVSFRADSATGDNVGYADVLLHVRDGEPVMLARLNMQKYGTQAEVTRAVLERFNEFYYGQSGRLLDPPAWLVLARDYVPAASSSEPPGKPLLDAIPIARDANGKLIVEHLENGGIKPVRELALPLLGYAALLGTDTTDLKQLQALLDAKLAALGASTPATKLVEGRLRLSLADGELLLKALAFKKAAAPFVNDSAWQPLLRIDGQLQFVLPVQAFARFERINAPANATASQMKAALNARLTTFSMGDRVTGPLTLGGQEVLAIPPVDAHKLLQTSTFGFMPTVKSLDMNNMYWATVLSDLAYLDFNAGTTENDQLLSALKRFGFNQVKLIQNAGAEVMVVNNGQMTAVVWRGTWGKDDILTDLKFWQSKPTEAAIKAYREKLEKDGKLENLTVGGKSINLHGGFAGQVVATLPSVAAAVRELDPTNQQPVWVIGHSMGGADAEISAPALKLQGLNIAGGYSIEGARAGDAGLAALARETGVAQSFFQLNNLHDPVPHVPTFKMGFKHYGYPLFPEEGSGQALWGLDPIERMRMVLGALPGGDALAAHTTGYNLDLESSLLGTQYTPPKDQPAVEQ